MPLKIARSISVNEEAMAPKHVSVDMATKQVVMGTSPPNGLYRCQASSYHGNHHPPSPLTRDVAPNNEEILTAVVLRRKKKSRSKSPSARHSAHIVTDLSYRNSFIDISPVHRHGDKRNSYTDSSPSRAHGNGYVLEASPSHSCHSFQSPVHSNMSPIRSNQSPQRNSIIHSSRRSRTRSPFRNLPNSQSSHEFYSSPVHSNNANHHGNRHSYVHGMSPVHSNGSPVRSNGSPAHSYVSSSPAHSNYSPAHCSYSPAHSNGGFVHSNQSTPSHRKDKSKRHSCIEISPSHSDNFYNNPLSKYHDYAEISLGHHPLPRNGNNNRHSFIETTSSHAPPLPRGRQSGKHSNVNRHSYAELSPARRSLYDNVDLSGVVLRRKPPPATPPDPPPTPPKHETRASPIREIIRRFSLRYKKKKPEKTERKRPRK